MYIWIGYVALKIEENDVVTVFYEVNIIGREWLLILWNGNLEKFKKEFYLFNSILSLVNMNVWFTLKGIPNNNPKQLQQAIRQN